MKILFTWITCVTLVFSITIGWYISQNLVTQISYSMLSDVTGRAASLRDLIQFMNIIWGPLFDILVIIWAIASSQSDDNISRMM